MAPRLAVHGSTQLTVHSLDGVRLRGAGHGPGSPSRELSRDAIEHICLNSPIEIETFVHGALCMCYSGQCFFSSVIGGRSGNRGLCPAMPSQVRLGERADANPSPSRICPWPDTSRSSKAGGQGPQDRGPHEAAGVRLCGHGDLCPAIWEKPGTHAGGAGPVGGRFFPAGALPTATIWTGRGRRCSASGRRPGALGLFLPRPGLSTRAGSGSAWAWCSTP